MDFEFSDEQKMLRTTLGKVVTEKIEPALVKYPEAPLPKELLVEFRDLMNPLGLTGCRVPEELGGSGLGAMGMGIAAELIPYPVFEPVMCAEVVATRIALGGGDYLKKTYISPLVNGEIFAGSGTSEPNVGSDPRGVETKAVLEGDEYVLNGNKIWVSAGAISDILLIVAGVGKDEKGRSIITPFIVEVEKVSGLEARVVDLVGIKQAHLSEVFLDNVRIPKESVFAEAQGHAHRILTSTWLSQRPVVGLANIHNANKAYEAALAYALQRKQFGKPIASFQLVQNMLVEMLTLIDASKLLCYRALALSDKGNWCSKESSVAKWYACDSSLRVTTLAVEVHGSFGITTEFPVERYYRDARVLAFPDGTIEIQKLIVGRDITGIRAFY